MRNAFLKLLNGEVLTEVVWTADISYWVDARKAAGTANPAWLTERGFLELHRSLGIMPYYYYGKFWTATAEFSDTIEFSQQNRGYETESRFRTPVGTLIERNIWSPTSFSSGCRKHFVDSEKDLDVLLYLLEHRRLRPVNLADYPARAEMWQQFDGLPCLGLPRAPFSAFVYEWAGIGAATYLLADCETKVQHALDLMATQEIPILEEICQVRPPLVHFPDNLSSENFTGFYDQFMAPNHRQRLARLHAAGIKAAVHLDGTVKGLLPKLVKAGFDAIEALTPKPAGDLEVAEMNTLAGSETVILWGGVPGVMFAPPFTWQDMQIHVEKVLECWNRHPFVLGVADQVPPNGDIQFCRRIAEML